LLSISCILTYYDFGRNLLGSPEIGIISSGDFSELLRKGFNALSGILLFFVEGILERFFDLSDNPPIVDIFIS